MSCSFPFRTSRHHDLSDVEELVSTRYGIQFSEVHTPIAAPVSKFGGQPSWLEKPQWPISRESKRPMRFICQIEVPHGLVAASVPRLAYIFMTDGDEYVDGTWEPEGGENAIVIQPAGGPLLVDAVPVAEGPTLYRMVQKPGAARLTPEPCEYAVALTKGQDPDFVSEETRFASFSEAQTHDYLHALEGNKIGGTPMFIQSDEFPTGGAWVLLLQLDSTAVPFHVNFGDAGVGYAFVSQDGTQGRLLWQCA